MASNLEFGETGSDRLKAWIRRHSVGWNRACAVALALSLAAILWSLPIQQFARGVQAWSWQPGPWGAVIFAGAFVLLSVCCLPTWPLPFVSGAAFGPVWGTVLASASCVLASGVGFGLARALGRTKLRSYLEASPRLRAVEHTVQKADWKIVAAVRLSHVLPFGMQNYAFGLTRIGFRPFAIATWAITFPGITLQAYLGHLGFASVEAWQASSAADWQTWGLRIGGLLLVAAAVGYIGYLGRSVYRTAVQAELEKELEAEQRIAHESGSWPWLSVILAALAALFAAAAIAAVLAQDVLRTWFERG